MISLKRESRKPWNPHGEMTSKREISARGGRTSISRKSEKGDPDSMTKEEIKGLLEECKQPFNVRHVTMVKLLRSRHVSEILVGLGKCIAKFNMAGIKIDRLHSDRAKEFLSKRVDRWCSEHDVRGRSCF